MDDETGRHITGNQQEKAVGILSGKTGENRWRVFVKKSQAIKDDGGTMHPWRTSFDGLESCLAQLEKPAFIGRINVGFC